MISQQKTCSYCMFMASIFFDVVQRICLGYKMILPRLPPPKMHECHQKKAKFQKGDASFSNHLENLVSLSFRQLCVVLGVKKTIAFQEKLPKRPRGGRFICKKRCTYNTYTHTWYVYIFCILYYKIYVHDTRLSINISDVILKKRWFLWGAMELVHKSPIKSLPNQRIVSELYHDLTILIGL